MDQARRRVLLGAAAFVALPVWESRAAWDGSSAAVGSCPLGEEGDECRVQTLKCARRCSTAQWSADLVDKTGRTATKALLLVWLCCDMRT